MSEEAFDWSVEDEEALIPFSSNELLFTEDDVPLVEVAGEFFEDEDCRDDNEALGERLEVFNKSREFNVSLS